MQRNTNNSIIAGVCSGLADDLGIPATVVRLAFLAAFFFFGFGPLIYLILWLLMPKKAS